MVLRMAADAHSGSIMSIDIIPCAAGGTEETGAGIVKEPDLMKHRINYFDCHVDTLTEIPVGESLNHNRGNLDLERVRNFAENYIQVFALWKDRAQMAKQNPETEFMQLYDRAAGLLKSEQERIVLCRNGSEMRQTLSEGKMAAFLAVEDISIMGSCIDKIRELGVSIAMLTWNYENEYGTGAAFRQQQGLTEKGKRTAKELLAQKIILDVSHLSDTGAADLFSMTDAPVIASHSNVRELCFHPRNLTLSHIREIIRRKGMIGMNYYGPFIEEKEPAEVTALLRHMDYILNQGGEDALVLGSDFDGCSNRFPTGVTGVESIPFLMEEMERAGFGEKIIQKIFWENGYKFFQNIEG